MAKEGSTRKHLAVRSRKLIRDADINILSSRPTAIMSVEYLNPLNGDQSFVVNGNPGSSVVFCVADCPGIAIMPCIVHGTMRVDVTVDTVGRFSSTMCG